MRSNPSRMPAIETNVAAPAVVYITAETTATRKRRCRIWLGTLALLSVLLLTTHDGFMGAVLTGF